MAKPDYPDGITKMDDYLGRRVKLTRQLSLVGGLKLERGTVLYVTGHHRGRLSLSLTPGGRTYARQIPRSDIELAAATEYQTSRKELK